MADKQFHVGAGAFGIYAGTLKKNNKNLWDAKSQVTEEAIEAVRDYMVNECLGSFDRPDPGQHGYSWKLKDGRTVKLLVEIDR